MEIWRKQNEEKKRDRGGVYTLDASLLRISRKIRVGYSAIHSPRYLPLSGVSAVALGLFR